MNEPSRTQVLKAKLQILKDRKAEINDEIRQCKIELLSTPSNKTSRRVGLMSVPQGEVEREFNSVPEAAKAFSKTNSPQAIYKSCNNSEVRAHGFYWKYLD